MLRPGEISIVLFAGGGGADQGIKQATGRDPEEAVNHDAEALAMHKANFPGSRHHQVSVYAKDPRDVAMGRPVGLLWASPDCKHFSKAKGGTPVSKNIRDLAWVVVHYAEMVKPRAIFLENVEEFRGWGPVVAVPDQPGRYMPDPARKGQEFQRWVKALKKLGYAVEWRELRACDYGAPTIRKRLFVIARRDGEPIVWPEPTHGPGRPLPWRVAAEIIDWSLACPSIFLSKEEGRAIGVNRPLAEATMTRIAKGVKRYVIDAAEPFIVRTDMASAAGRNGVHGTQEPTRTQATAGSFALVTPFVSYAQQGGGNRDAAEPLHTVCASRKDQNCLVVPTLIQTGYGERAGQEPRVPGLEKPLGTVVAGAAKHAVVAAHITKFRANSVGSGIGEPVDTITANSFIKKPGGAPTMGLVSAFLAKHYGGVVGVPVTKPAPTVTGIDHSAVVSAFLLNQKGADQRDAAADAPSPTQCAQGNHIAAVHAFLMKYYGQDQDPQMLEALHTVTTRDRFGLVTVSIAGEPYVIVDIGMRMLTPRELFRAQGFPDSYIIDPVAPNRQGKLRPLPKDAQIRMCGNSVCPPVAEALVRANFANDGIVAEAAE